MPYNEWKTLKHVLDGISNSSCVEIYYSTKDKQIEMCLLNAPFCKFTYSVEDNSFGQYLFFYVSRKLYGNTDVSISIEKNNAYKNIKEDNKMKFNFDFGPVTGNDVRMSLYGLAVKNKSGTYVSYDAKSGDIMDVDILNFEGAKFLYKMPVAIKDIAIGDVIVHHRVPMFVVAIAVNGTYITAVDPINGERKDIMLPKSPFGFNFATKVVNLLGNMTGTASAENPFGNLGMMMMLSEDDNGVKDMLPLMLMANGGNIDMSNPLMLYALMGNDGKMSDMLPFMFMMNANKLTTHECKCNINCAGTAVEA